MPAVAYAYAGAKLGVNRAFALAIKFAPICVPSFKEVLVFHFAHKKNNSIV